MTQARQRFAGFCHGLWIYLGHHHGWTSVARVGEKGAGDTAADQQGFRDGGGLHVVELVVSNGFAPDPGPAERPWRSPATNFETQVQRWVFHYVPAGAGGACGFPAP